MNALINKINNNEEEVRKLFKDNNKNESLKILKQIQNKLKETVFSEDILTPNSKVVIALFEQIKKDLSKIYDIHQKYINIIEEQTIKMKIGISENISCENNNDYIKILNDSRSFLIIQSMILKEKKLKNFQIIVMLFSFGFFYTIIKQKHLEKNFQKKIKNIYSEVKIDTEIDTNNFSFEESMFYKTKKTKEYIKNLIDFLTEKYKEIKLNKKYYSICKQEETFKNCNLMMNQFR